MLHILRFAVEVGKAMYLKVLQGNEKTDLFLIEDFEEARLSFASPEEMPWSRWNQFSALFPIKMPKQHETFLWTRQCVQDSVFSSFYSIFRLYSESPASPLK